MGACRSNPLTGSRTYFCTSTSARRRYMADDTLQEFVERNMGKILLVLVLILMALFGSVRTFLRRSLRRRSGIPLLSVTLQVHR
jgi:hypothetical protein